MERPFGSFMEPTHRTKTNRFASLVVLVIVVVKMVPICEAFFLLLFICINRGLFFFPLFLGLGTADIEILLSDFMIQIAAVQALFVEMCSVLGQTSPAVKDAENFLNLFDTRW